MVRVCLFLIAGTQGFGAETLHLRFGQPQEVAAGTERVRIDGSFTEGKYLATGRSGVAIPARPFLGEHAGTVLFRFKERAETGFPLVPRYLLTLRTRSRLSATFVLFRNRSALTFSFSDRDKSFTHRFSQPLAYDRDHQIGFTYDGASVCVYLDGVLVAEGSQPLPLLSDKLDKIHIGPAKDAWIAHKPWGDETLAGELRVWDEALTPHQIARLSGVKFTPLRESHPPRLTVPALAGAAPAIDGDLADQAWRYAASMPRLIRGDDPKRSGKLPPHRFLVTWDRDQLYLGLETLFPAGTALQAGEPRKAEGEGEPGASESFEVRLQTGGKLYQFGGNVAGGSRESLDGDPEWNGPWRYASTLKMRIDDSRCWQGEVAIPWKTFGLERAPQEPVKFNFCRRWKLPGCDTVSSLSAGGADSAQPEDFVAMNFVPEGPTVQVLEHNDPAGGQAVQKFAIATSAAGTVNYRFALGRLDGSAAPLDLVDREFQLGAGEVYTEELATRIGNPGYDCLLYTLSQGSAVAMRAIVPFELEENHLAVQSLFLREQLRVTVPLATLVRKFGAAFRGRLELTGPDGKPGFAGEVGQSEITIPFPRSSAPGAYKLSLVDSASGQTVGVRELNYPGIGSWERMTFDDRIVPPFTPLDAKAVGDGLTAAPWNRVYRWEKSLLPTQITSGETPLLAAPAVLMASGQPVAIDRFNAGPVAAHRAEFHAAGEDERCAIEERGWIEYDGLLWNELKLEAKKPLEEVKAVITLPNSVAKYVHASGLGGWSSQITAAVAPGERQLRFYPVVWIGREDKGLCFFAESRKTWLAPEQGGLRLVKGTGETDFEVHLARRMKAGEILQVEFGLLASPVKPLPANYPLNTLSSSYAAALNRPGRAPTSDVIYLTERSGADLGSFFGDLPTEFGARMQSAMARGAAQARQFGGRPIPYTCARFLSGQYPEMSAFKDEWIFQPEIAMDYDRTGHFVYDCCPVTGASAFYIQRVQEMFRRTPDLRGIYFDFGVAGLCNNAIHGCQQRYPLLALREFYRRVALAQLDAGIREPVTVVHNTDEVVLPAFTFVTHLLNGERVRQASSTLLHDRKDILDSYGLETFACELSSLPFGLTNSVYMPFDKLSPEYGGTEEDGPYKFRMSKAALAGTLIHGTLPCLWRMHFGIFDKLVRVYDEFEVPRARFVGYWDEPAEVLAGQDIYVSVYRHPRENRLLAVMGHVGKPHVNQDLRIAFDFAKLGVQNLRRAVDKMTEPDPGYAELFKLQEQHRVPPVRAPLELGDFGSRVRSFHGNILTLHLDFHCFAIVELCE